MANQLDGEPMTPERQAELLHELVDRIDAMATAFDAVVIQHDGVGLLDEAMAGRVRGVAAEMADVYAAVGAAVR
jgi:hypothetical protein